MWGGVCVWELPAAVWLSPVCRVGARWHGVGQHYAQCVLGDVGRCLSLRGSSGCVAGTRLPCGCALAWRGPALRSVRAGGCGEVFEFGSFQRPCGWRPSAVWVRVGIAWACTTLTACWAAIGRVCVWELPAAVWLRSVCRVGARWHGVGQHYAMVRRLGWRRLQRRGAVIDVMVAVVPDDAACPAGCGGGGVRVAAGG